MHATPHRSRPRWPMSKVSTPPGDSYRIRCPRLGHEIPFSYCRGEHMGLPCVKTLDCWHRHFPVVEFLRKELSPEQWDEVFSGPPRSKMHSLLELIARAKEREAGPRGGAVTGSIDNGAGHGLRCSQRVAGVVLAAGESLRMGRPKQMLPFHGGILVERVLTQALCSDLDLVVLVLGYRAREIVSMLGARVNHPKLRVVTNEGYRDGLSSSLIAGLEEVEQDHDHAMILLGDMPHVSSGLINILLHTHVAEASLLGAVRVGERRSHPVIFSRALYPELRRLTGDVGARHLFARYGEQACFVTPADEYDGRDIDTPEDYAALGDAPGPGPDTPHR